MEAMSPTLDPITFEVVRNALSTLVAEMKIIVMRSAYCTLWRETGDLSCALLNARGDSVVQGRWDEPVHLATMPFSVKGALRKLGADQLEPGDVIFHNDPEWGNNHLPDCLMAKPIFYADRLIAFAAVRGHWSDIGGMSPGSYMTVSRELIQEGLRIPPLKICRRGAWDQQVIDVIMANVRGPDERIGDFRAQYAGCLACEKKFLSVVEKYGLETVMACTDSILDRSEALTRQEIAKIPSGNYGFEDWLDGDGVVDERIRLKVRVAIDGSVVTVDFGGSHPQTAGGMNSPLSVTTTAVLYAIKAITDPWNPANSGSYRPVRVDAPEGTFVNPKLPAPVVGSNAHTSNRIVDAIFGALAAACPERIIAGGSGSSVVLLVGGTDSRTGRNNRGFVFLEPHGGAGGARATKDGVNAIRVGVGNSSNHSVEIVEREYPLRVLEYVIVADKGGAGTFRGGCPVRRVYQVLTGATLNIVAERGLTLAHGVQGGKPGGRAEFWLNPGTPRAERLPSKTPLLAVEKGTIISVQSAGGGGFGDPRHRDPEAVRLDVRNQYVTIEGARREYGMNGVSLQNEGRKTAPTACNRIRQ